MNADTVTANLNADKRGVEIHFPSKPADDVREQLRLHGWRWSPFGRCWYHRDSPDTRAFAETLTGVSLTPHDA